MVRTKVFVGNLAFSTKEPELAAAFGAAGKVIGANIITRGPRSLGYGFVEMESEEDANKAVELMNKKELNGRQINVEVAKPQEEGKEKEPREQGEGGRRRAGRQRSYRKRTEEGEEADDKAEEGEEGKDGSAPRRRPRRRPRVVGTGQKRVEDSNEREESKTTLFVANLPFALDDEGFAKVVTELGVKPTTAHVVKKRNGRSKGYGFVEFENEADQKKALDGLNKKVVDARELSVKVALTEQARGEEEKPAQPAEKKTVPAEKKAAPAEKKVVPPAEKKAAPAEKKAAPAEKKVVPPAEKKATTPEKKPASPAEKKAAPPAEKKSTPPAEKKAETPAKTTDKK
jgi:RNA recognition motif-containing protein